jgi:nicotinamide-nucleotide amidase
MEAAAAEALQACRCRGWRMATTESCTGGMVAAAMTHAAGSSDVFEAAFVTYSNDAKMRMVGVDSATLERYGAVSEETAHEMAEGAVRRVLTCAGVGVSVTGVAGPGPSDSKPEGRVCFGVCVVSDSGELVTSTQTVEFGELGREKVRLAATVHALAMVVLAAQQSRL